jgi:putative lipoprotein
MNSKVCSALCWALALSACSKPPAPGTAAPAAQASLSGTVSLAEPAVPGAQAALELSLTDVSAAEGSIEVAKKLLKPAHYPAEFELPYDSGAIDARHRYTVAARVLEGAQPRWVTDTAYPVITLGNPVRLDLQLVRSGANGQSAAPAADAPPAFEGKLQGPSGVTTYRAYFRNSQLARIEEGQNKQQMQYEYFGARLQHYVARDAATGASLELKFDENGKLSEAAQIEQGRAVKVESQTIDQVRNRAALLRSHALATREIKEHERSAAAIPATAR